MDNFLRDEYKKILHCEWKRRDQRKKNEERKTSLTEGNWMRERIESEGERFEREFEKSGLETRTKEGESENTT